MSHPLLRSHDHRPWPIPDRPWVMTQTWNKLLFAHWPVPAEQLRPLIPAPLVLDTYEGQAWVGVVPFLMTDIRFRMLPEIPGTHTFLELNVRTYVTINGKPGVWFFSLDASNRPAVEAARASFFLSYFHAKMDLQEQGTSVYYSSQRTDKRSAPGDLNATYQPVSDVYYCQPGSLESFLTDRYCLYSYSKRLKKLFRADIHHMPWPLQLAEASFHTNTVAHAAGITLPDVPPLLHYSERLPMLAWYLETVT